MNELWFALIGCIFAIVCSLNAKKKNRLAENWFILGFVFWFIALFILIKLPYVEKDTFKIIYLLFSIKFFKTQSFEQQYQLRTFLDNSL